MDLHEYIITYIIHVKLQNEMANWFNLTYVGLIFFFFCDISTFIYLLIIVSTYGILVDATSCFIQKLINWSVLKNLQNELTNWGFLLSYKKRFLLLLATLWLYVVRRFLWLMMAFWGSLILHIWRLPSCMRIIWRSFDILLLTIPITNVHHFL